MKNISKEKVFIWATIIGVVVFVAILMHEINVLLDLLMSCHVN